jgi:hypothetical protein
MVLRIPLRLRLRRTDASMRKVSRLVHLARGGVNRAALGLGDGAVVAAAGAVLDGAAGELCRDGFVDAGAVGACGVLEDMGMVWRCFRGLEWRLRQGFEIG